MKALGPEPALHVAAENELPDIYYIVPEDYGRVDLLKSWDNIDTSQFVKYLKDTGFYVAECSQSNFAMESELVDRVSAEHGVSAKPESQVYSHQLDQGPIWNVPSLQLRRGRFEEDRL